MRRHEMPSATLRRRERLASQKEFTRLVRRGRRFHAGAFTAYAAEGGGKASRLGLIASRRVGNAVQRNRLKRLLREAFRLHKCLLPRPLDIVLRAREGSGGKPRRLADVERELLAVFTSLQKNFPA